MRRTLLFFLPAAALLLPASGLALFLAAPASPRHWEFWFAAECLALPVLFLALYRKTNWRLPRLTAVAPTTLSWICLALALALDAAVLFWGPWETGARQWLGDGLVRVSLWSVLLATIFATLRIATATTWRAAATLLLPLLPHLCTLYLQPDIIGLLLQICCLAGLIPLCRPGSWRVKVALLLPLLLFTTHVVVTVSTSPFSRSRLEVMIHPENDPYGAGYQAIQHSRAFHYAGLWGQGRATLERAPLPRPTDLSINALPWFALWLGNAATGAFIFLLAGMLGLSGWLALRQPHGPRRTVASGIWLLLTMSQIIAIAAQLGLLPLTGGYGIAFLGRGDTGLLILLLVASVLPPAMNAKAARYDATVTSDGSDARATRADKDTTGVAAGYGLDGSL